MNDFAGDVIPNEHNNKEGYWAMDHSFLSYVCVFVSHPAFSERFRVCGWS